MVEFEWFLHYYESDRTDLITLYFKIKCELVVEEITDATMAEVKMLYITG